MSTDRAAPGGGGGTTRGRTGGGVGGKSDSPGTITGTGTRAIGVERSMEPEDEPSSVAGLSRIVSGCEPVASRSAGAGTVRRGRPAVPSAGAAGARVARGRGVAGVAMVSPRLAATRGSMTGRGVRGGERRAVPALAERG